MLRRIASRKWRSRLNWNGRWFVRQSSFSGFARRSFLRQLRGEKDQREGASPVRFFRLASAFRVLLLTIPSPILTLSLFFFFSCLSLSHFSFPCSFRGYSTYGCIRRTPSPLHVKKASGIVFEIRFPR